MLSELPKLADKAFVLGFFLPTLLFVLAAAGIYYDQPWAAKVLAAASQKDGWDSLAYFILTVWVLSVLLMMINHAELQLLGGYVWPRSKKSWLWRHERKRFDRESRRFRALDGEWKTLKTLGVEFPEGKKRQWETLRRNLVKKFPVNPDDHRPTRFGNAVSAFEAYSRHVYGADNVSLWLHLSTVIPADFQTPLDDARARVNCAVNICFFAFALALATATCFVVDFDLKSLGDVYTSLAAMSPILRTSSFWFLAWTIAAAIVCRAAYLFSIELTYAWGNLVKAAFDCYLPDLAKKLGFELPETVKRRREFWAAVSEQSIYWRRVKPEDWKPTVKPPPDDNPGLPNALAKLADAIMHGK